MMTTRHGLKLSHLFSIAALSAGLCIGVAGCAADTSENPADTGENTGEAVSAEGFCGGTDNPIGLTDTLVGSSYPRTLYGWAYDPSSGYSSQSIDVHLYYSNFCGGNRTFIGAATANLVRSDVNSACGVSGNHGYALSVPDPALYGFGSVAVLEVWGINVGPGSNARTDTYGIGGGPRRPACTNSSRELKKDIRYLTDAERVEMARQVQSIPLATYEYKDQERYGRGQKLGLIIEDNPEVYAINREEKVVDLYSYTSMLVATTQVQAQQIDELRREVDALKKLLGPAQKKGAAK